MRKLSYMKNPMDWRPIDRLLLLASLVFMVPSLFGSVLAAAMIGAPDYFDLSLAWWVLGFYSIYAISLAVLIGVGFYRRGYEDDWPAFETYIIWSYVISVLVTTYMAGTYLTQGLLLLFLGVNITSALSNIDKVRRAYWWVIASTSVMTLVNTLLPGTHGPIFSKSMYMADGTPLFWWNMVNVLLVAILSALIFLCTSVFKRWSEREELYKQMSKVDGLTQLTNRRSLIDQGDKIIERGRREMERHKAWVSCIMLDLDHFKKINDRWGHAAGDEALVRTSQIMTQSVRSYDEVGRYGGEEFCILLPSTPPKCAELIAERIRENIESALISFDGNPLKITASLGVASLPYAQIGTLNELLLLADEALYVSKDSGRNKVTMAEKSGVASQTVEFEALKLGCANPE